MTQNKPIVWTKQNSDIALLLAEGYTIREVSERVGVSDKTVVRRKADPEFMQEVDRLTLMIGIASRAERLKIVNRVLRQKIRQEIVDTDKDLLDWLKYAQSETDGVKLNLVGNLASILTNDPSLAGSGQTGTISEDGEE